MPFFKKKKKSFKAMHKNIAAEPEHNLPNQTEINPIHRKKSN